MLDYRIDRERSSQAVSYTHLDVYKRQGGYYRITKEMQVLDGKAPMVVVDNQTGAVIQMSMIA